MDKKRIIIRSCAIIAIILLAFLMYFIGREHTVLVDNKTVTLDNGTEIKALQVVEVQVDKQESMELAARDRDKYTVTSQSHKITVSYTDSDWNEKSFTVKFKVPSKLDMVIISIPTLVADPEADSSVWMREYVQPTVAITAQDAAKENGTENGEDDTASMEEFSF